MNTNVKLSIASNLNRLLNSAKSNLEMYDKHLDKSFVDNLPCDDNRRLSTVLSLWTRCEILDGIKFYESKLTELDPINKSPAGVDWEYFCSVNY